MMPKDLRMTAGSTSVRAFEQPLREAAAVARAMLVAAAAGRWNVDERECETADGYVISGARTLSFGELAEEAAGRSPPSRPALRQSGRSRLIGRPLGRLDAPAKTDGSMRFAGDVRLPGMLFASARLAPPGGRLTDFAREAISRIPGRASHRRPRRLVCGGRGQWLGSRPSCQGRESQFHRQSLAGAVARAVRRCAEFGRLRPLVRPGRL